jgi:hypothetical protein
MESKESALESRDWHQYEPDLLWLCEVKAKEFHLMGYEEVTAIDIWQCVLQLTKGARPLHQMVAAILGLQPGQFMHYETMNAWQGRV